MERCELCDSIAWSVIVNVESLFERDVEEDGEHTLKALPHVTKEATREYAFDERILSVIFQFAQVMP